MPNFFAMAEGFYDYDNFRYIYQYKDNLGNTRLNFGRDENRNRKCNIAVRTDSGGILQFCGKLLYLPVQRSSWQCKGELFKEQRRQHRSYGQEQLLSIWNESSGQRLWIIFWTEFLQELQVPRTGITRDWMVQF